MGRSYGETQRMALMASLFPKSPNKTRGGLVINQLNLGSKSSIA